MGGAMRGATRVGRACAVTFVGCHTSSGGVAPPPMQDAAPADAEADAGDAAPPCTKPYPAGPYGTKPGATLQNYTWAGVGTDGATRPIALGDYLACGSSASLLAIRVGASWCGTCQWYA